MSYLAAFGGLTSVGLLAGLVIMKLRMDGLYAEARLSRKNRLVAVAAMEATATEYKKFRDRSEAKEATLLLKLEHYENHELDAIEKEPNRDVRIRRRRDWISSVLSEATGAKS